MLYNLYSIIVYYFRFFKDGLNCSISTDDPGIMLITIFDDYTEVKNRMGLSIKNIQQMVNTQPSSHPNLNPRPIQYRLTGIFISISGLKSFV